MGSRNVSHFQKKEPPLENILQTLRFRKIEKYIPANTHVLDLGCGYQGKLLQLLSNKIKHGVGYDISVSKKPIANNIKLKSGQVDTKLPFNKNNFDLVIASAVIEHVKHLNFLISEAYRLLKPGGQLLLTTPSIKARPLLSTLAQFKLLSRKEIADHKRYYTKEKLINLLTKNGFSEKKIEASTFEFGFNIFVKATK